MLRCKTCKKIYYNTVKYCDCGSNDFEQINTNSEPAAKKELTVQELVSWIIFILCFLGAVLVWFV